VKNTNISAARKSGAGSHSAGSDKCFCTDSGW